MKAEVCFKAYKYILDGDSYLQSMMEIANNSGCDEFKLIIAFTPISTKMHPNILTYQQYEDEIIKVSTVIDEMPQELRDHIVNECLEQKGSPALLSRTVRMFK